MIATDPRPLDLSFAPEADDAFAPAAGGAFAAAANGIFVPEVDGTEQVQRKGTSDAERKSSAGAQPAAAAPRVAAVPASGATVVSAKVAVASAVASPAPTPAASPAVSSKPSMLECLRADAARYGEFGGGKWYSELGFWITATHRYGAWCWSLPFALRLPLGMPFRIINRFWRFFLHVNISVKAEIGPGLCLIHPTSIMIPSTKIGSNVLIFHEVTIGANLTRQGHPTIGNNVDVYVGARILGGIKIGDNSKIGANCVVTSNVAPNSVVFSAPTRTLQGRA